MGNTCTLSDHKKNITIPSKVIQIQTNHNPLKITYTISSTVKQDSQSLTLIRCKSQTSEPFTAGLEADEEQRTNYTLRPLTLKYDLHELGIGEYYLEKELDESKKQEVKRQKKHQVKASIKWDRAVVQMRVKFPQSSLDDPFYNQVDNCLKEYAALKPRSFAKMMRRGPPMRYRWSVWKNILEPDRFYVSELYDKLKGLTSPWENDIRKDLHRTFPDEPYFSSEKFNNIGQEQLFNVLKAISLYLPNVGYTQSMNFLVAFLLLISGGNELETFWAFITLARDHRFLMMGFFEKGFPLLNFYIFVFYEVLEIEMPALYEHLKQQQVPDELWLLKWFFTVFLYNLPPKYVVRIWDFILMEGLLGIIKVSLGIIKILEKDILLLDAFGIDLLFKYLKDEGNRMTNISHVNANAIPPNNNNLTNQEGPEIADLQSPIVINNVTSMLYAQEPGNRSYVNIDQSNANNHSIPRVVNGPGPNCSHINQTQRDNQGNLQSIYNDTSEIHYNTKQLDIDEVLDFAERTTMTIEKLLYYADLYTEKTKTGLPEPYNKFFKNIHLYQTDVNKIFQLQSEIDFHLMKSELCEKPNTEIVVSNLLAIEDDTLILKDLGF